MTIENLIGSNSSGMRLISDLFRRIVLTLSLDSAAWSVTGDETAEQESFFKYSIGTVTSHGFRNIRAEPCSVDEGGTASCTTGLATLRLVRG